MKSQDVSTRYQEPSGKAAAAEEVEITRLINDRLRQEDCMEAADRETVAYRIAEIMVSARRMYTTTLPRLTNVNGESELSMDDDMEGLRTTFLHLRDLLHDFDSTFFAALHPDGATYNFDGEEEVEEEDELASEDDEASDF